MNDKAKMIVGRYTTMGNGFTFLEHTADILIRAWGRTIDEAFEQAGRALFEIMTDISELKSKIKYTFKLEAEDLQSLLYDYLDELIYIFDAERIAFTEFKVRIKEVPRCSLDCEAWGEKFDPQRHVQKTEVKAPTYAQMEIGQEHEKITLQYVLDI
ncbi:MAG: archease [Promethearchaeota archaeon]